MGHRFLLALPLMLLTAGAIRTSAAPPTAPPSQPPTNPGQLSTQTTVRLETLDRLKSGAQRKGDRIRLQVAEEVLDPAGAVLIRKGTPALGTVQESRGAGSFGRRGRLTITVDHTTAADGQNVRLRATQERSGSGKTGAAAAVSVLLFLPGGFFIKGKNAEIPPNTVITAWVDEPVVVQVGASRASTRRTVHLKNGDKITGAVEGPKDGYYTISTENGILRYRESDVQRVEDRQP